MACEAPQWESLFWSYKDNICRADLARYLILQRYGGIYADLDYECLSPLDPLIDSQALVLGLEPNEHTKFEGAIKAGMSQIACNAFMGSISGHPFWGHLLVDLQKTAKHSDPLEATGPFRLTRSLSSYLGDDFTILASSQLYPVTKDECWSGKIDELEFFTQATKNAYGVHYWEGSWFPRAQIHTQELRHYPAVLKSYLPEHRKSDLGQIPAQSMETDYPLVSCLMVTKGKAQVMRGALECFEHQTYPHKELVIISDISAHQLAFLISEYEHLPIRWILGVSSQLTLGELRNLSVDLAEGEYVCQWDDDDFYDPSRITLQMATLMALGADACLLEKWLVWWPLKERLIISGKRLWEGSIIINKKKLSRYPALRRGEDTVVIQEMLSNCMVATLNLPRLYIYTVHESNTFDEAHFEDIYKSSSVRCEGEGYRRMMQELDKRLPVLSSHAYVDLTINKGKS